MSSASPSPASRISNDGLRYHAKKAGTQFTPTGVKSYGAAIMSCFRCGKHQPRELLEGKKFLGKVHYVCKPSEPCNRTSRAS